jgi:hypothetical protein
VISPVREPVTARGLCAGTVNLDENAATLTFVSSGDVKADLQMIDLLLGGSQSMTFDG